MESPKIETEIITMRIWRPREAGKRQVINRGISCTGEVLALKCIEVRKETFSKSILTFYRKL